MPQKYSWLKTILCIVLVEDAFCFISCHYKIRNIYFSDVARLFFEHVSIVICICANNTQPWPLYYQMPLAMDMTLS